MGEIQGRLGLKRQVAVLTITGDHESRDTYIARLFF